MIFGFITVLVIIAGVLFLIGRDIFRAISKLCPRVSKWVFWPLFALFSIIVIYFRSPFAGILYFSVFSFPILKAVRKVILKINPPENIMRWLKTLWLRGFLPLSLAFSLTVISYVNVMIPKTTEYRIETDKKLSKDYKIVYISDMHIGSAVKEKLLDSLVSEINSISPDIVCFGGDIFDESTDERLFDYAIQNLSKIEADNKFFVFGNHERKNSYGKIEAALEGAGVSVLTDETADINSEISVIGRYDRGFSGQTGRADLEKLISDTDKDKTIILLDHQPCELENSEKLGVNLQLSGHTHAGQLIPLNFIASLTNEYGYGHLQSSGYDLIVSSGYGVWGFPLRLGSRSEIVSLTLSEK